MNKWVGFSAAILVLASMAHAGGVKVLNASAQFPEGPVWYKGKLYYVEYDRNTVTAWDGKKNTTFASDPGCGPSAVVVTPSGEFVTTCYDNGSIGRISQDGKVLGHVTQDKDGHRFIAPNDFAPAGDGGIYFTDSGHEATASDGKVFHIARDGVVTLSADGFRSTNGLAVSRDGKTLYVIETETHQILAYAIGSDATLTGRRLFVNLDDLNNHVESIFPDGMKVDSKGLLYIGQSPRKLGGPLNGEIFVVDANAKLIRTLKLPSPQVPNLAFSPDEKTVYVTAVDVLDKVPHTGKVYAIGNR